tara:strand:- start:912 stop:1181 length:270 start_codon:yes stop_codon:yes gene_type:complete
MSDYDNTNSGALFKNDGKQGNQPDYRGPLNVGGKDFEVSAWIKKSQAGKSFMSLSIQEKDAWKKDAPKAAPKADKAEKWNDDFEDDIPF